MQADSIVSVTFVNGGGNITVARANSALLTGIVGGVGLLGILTEVTLKVCICAYC
jgi:FAD/FMN-containing dehydrogenase